MRQRPWHRATGLLVAPRDADQLAIALAQLIKETEMRERMGAAARSRAITLFSQQRITEGLRCYYEQILEDRMTA